MIEFTGNCVISSCLFISLGYLHVRDIYKKWKEKQNKTLIPGAACFPGVALGGEGPDRRPGFSIMPRGVSKQQATEPTKQLVTTCFRPLWESLMPS